VLRRNAIPLALVTIECLLERGGGLVGGTPNTAITASPMNFSTLPSYRSTIACMRSK
jgi:hypothetical protein